jgi:hypothetical protein
MIEEERSVTQDANVKKYEIGHYDDAKVTDNGKVISYICIKLVYSSTNSFTQKELKQSLIFAFSKLEDRIEICSNRVCIIGEDTILFHYSIDNDDEEYNNQDYFSHFHTDEKLRHELIKNINLFLDNRMQFRIDRKEVSLNIEVEYVEEGHIHIWIEGNEQYYITDIQALHTFQNAGIQDVEHIGTSETIRNGKRGLKLILKSPRLLQSGFAMYEWFAIHLIDDTIEAQNDILDLLLDDTSDAIPAGITSNAIPAGITSNDITSDDIAEIANTEIAYAAGNKRSRDDDILYMPPPLTKHKSED